TITASHTNELGQTVVGTGKLEVTNTMTGIRIIAASDVFPDDSGGVIYIAAGLTQNLRAQALYLDNSLSNISDKVTWYVDYYSSGLGNHGYLDRSKVTSTQIPFVATSEGTIKVVATYLGATAEVTITVTEPTVATE